MSRAHRRERHDHELHADINVTSLVDVAFTLLVIFIITAPILQGGIEVAVPRADVTSISVEEDHFIVTITAEGTVFLEETELTVEQLAESLPQLLQASGAEIVYIRGDSLAAYGDVLPVIASVARNAGIRYALVGEALPPSS